MFSLIIVIAAIALVIAIVAASLYFGGGVTQGHDAAAAARIINEGSQISGAALSYHANTGVYASDMSTLVGANLLTSTINDKWSTAEGKAIYSGDVAKAQCEALNASYGVQGIPACDSLSNNATPVCCSDSTP